MKFKKVITIVLALTLFMSFNIFANAESAENVNYVYEVNHKTIIFNSDTAFNESERQHIIDSHFSDEAGDIQFESASFNILCIFGHKNVTENITIITHRYYSTAPRCLRESFKINECSRCGNTTKERIAYADINCCK